MERQNKTLLVIVIMLVVSVFTMAIGFAVQSYNATLKIDGKASFNAAKWDIKYDTTSYSEAASSVAASDHSLTATTLTFNVNLAEPGDFYEATADIINAGTFDANLISVVVTNPLTADQKKFASFKFYYGDDEYSTTTENLTIPLVKSNGKETVKVRVEYNQPQNEADLPQTSLENVEFAVTLNYEQAE